MALFRKQVDLEKRGLGKRISDIYIFKFFFALCNDAIICIEAVDVQTCLELLLFYINSRLRSIRLTTGS